MPHAFRVYGALRARGVADGVALAASSLVSCAKSGQPYNEDAAMDLLCGQGVSEPLAEAIARVIANCHMSERFSRRYSRSTLKFALVRSGWTGTVAEALLSAVEPCICTSSSNQTRVPIRYVPRAGRVIMCDFTHLSVPEMQKVRRAIIVSKENPHAHGRCTVVPVSKSRSQQPNAFHYEFAPASYPFFHQTDPVWAICDHVYTVALTRTWQIEVNGKPEIPTISTIDLAEIRKLVGTGLSV